MIAKKNTPFFILFMIIQPIADSFGGLFSDYFSISLFVRIIIIFLTLWYFAQTSVFKELFKYTTFLVYLYFIFITAIHSFYSRNGFSALSLELITLIKTLYLPIVTLGLWVLIKENRLRKNDLMTGIVVYGFCAISSVLLGYITGKGGEIGGRSDLFAANKGFFIGANEVGLILLLTLPFVFYYFRKIFKHHFLLFNIVVLYSIAGFIVFTKSSLFVLFLIVYLVLSVLKPLARSVFFAFCFFVICSLVIKYQKDIMSFLSSSFFISLINGDLLSFFFRGRQRYLDAILSEMAKFPDHMKTLFFSIGIGEFKMREISEIPLALAHGHGTTFEMDLFDYCAFYGFMGLSLATVSIYLSLKRMRYKTRITGAVAALLMTLMHSIIAGHVFLFSPQVSVLIGMSFLYNSRKLFPESNITAERISPC